MGAVDEDLLSIGELAGRAGVATSTVRFYERRGLLVADARRSGQRRYRPSALHRLAFIRLMQDAGLSLDDVAGILAAGSADEWKAIARRRLAALEAEIDKLQLARDYLRGALACRHEHPATECRVMRAEIAGRIGATAEVPAHG